MRAKLCLVAILAPVVQAACSSASPPVPLVADSLSLARLAGEWHGEYDSPATGRHGSIVFHIEAGRDTAHGDVTMIPAGWNRPLGPIDDPAAAARDAPIPRVLRVLFVRIEKGRVSGTLEPYRDPDCGCAVYTTFTGTVEKDLIAGTFTARPSAHPPYTGKWRVVRRAGGP